MKLIILLFIAFAFTGCAHQYLMKDCEEQGNSQYWKCHKLGVFEAGW